MQPLKLACFVTLGALSNVQTFIAIGWIQLSRKKNESEVNLVE